MLKCLSITLAVSTLILFSVGLSAQFSGGSGTELDPWQIANATDLSDIHSYGGVANEDKYFVQTTDIDLGTAPWNEGEGWTPLTGSTRFFGNYNGDGYIINNLTINRTDTNSQGLFAQTSGAVIRNVTLTNISFNGVRNESGGLVGRALSGTLIENCSVEGTYIGNNYHGLLVGVLNSSIVKNSFTEGDIQGTGVSIGGLVGLILDGQVIDSYSTAHVSSVTRNIGGLVGEHRGTITRSYASGDVSGSTTVGGLVGYVANNSNINNCYATGRATATELTQENLLGVGGFIGRINGPSTTIRNNFSYGQVVGVEGQAIGGFIGLMATAPIFENNYWDIEASGVDVSAAGEGKTTAEMAYPYSNQTYTAWDFTEIWEYDPGYYANNGYPFLRWQDIEVLTYPGICHNPMPAHTEMNIPLTQTEISWTYHSIFYHSDPLGFRVYFSDDENFGEDYTWVSYIENEMSYSAPIPFALEEGTTYYWQVVATTTDGAGREDAVDSPLWHFVTVPPTLDPPVNLTAEIVNYEILLSWNEPVIERNRRNDRNELRRLNLLGYNIYRDAEILNEELLVQTSYLDTDIVFDTNYEYFVTAVYDIFGESEASETVIASVQSPTLIPPVNLDYQVVGMDVHLSWDEPTEAENRLTMLGYNLYRNGQQLNNELIEETQFVDEAISYDTEYVYVVTAVYNFGESVFSNAVEVLITSPDLIPPSNLSYVVLESGIDLLWDAPQYSEDLELLGYKIYRNGALYEELGADVLTYSDEEVYHQTNYTYFVTAMYDLGESEPSNIVEVIFMNIDLSEPLVVRGNYPNPFNPSTTIAFTINTESEVSIDIFNQKGQRIRKLMQEHKGSGLHSAIWDGRDDRGRIVSSGVYFYRITSNNKIITNKMLLTK